MEATETQLIWLKETNELLADLEKTRCVKQEHLYQLGSEIEVLNEKIVSGKHIIEDYKQKYNIR